MEILWGFYKRRSFYKWDFVRFLLYRDAKVGFHTVPYNWNFHGKIKISYGFFTVKLKFQLGYTVPRLMSSKRSIRYTLSQGRDCEIISCDKALRALTTHSWRLSARGALSRYNSRGRSRQRCGIEDAGIELRRLRRRLLSYVKRRQYECKDLSSSPVSASTPPCHPPSASSLEPPHFARDLKEAPLRHSYLSYLSLSFFLLVFLFPSLTLSFLQDGGSRCARNYEDVIHATTKLQSL